MWDPRNGTPVLHLRYVFRDLLNDVVGCDHFHVYVADFFV